MTKRYEEQPCDVIAARVSQAYACVTAALSSRYETVHDHGGLADAVVADLLWAAQTLLTQADEANDEQSRRRRKAAQQ